MNKIDDANERLGGQIRKYRSALKMIQAEFAERLGVTGASVSAYENGIRQPSFDILIKIADILRVSTDSLLGRNKNLKKTIDVSQLDMAQIHIIEDIVATFIKYNEMNSIILKDDKLKKQLNSTTKY